MLPNAGLHGRRDHLVEACSIEIVAQSVLLLAVVVPTAILFFPSALIALAAFAGAQLYHELSPALGKSGDVSGISFELLVTAAFVTSLLYGVASVRYRFISSDQNHAGRRLRPLSGRQGDELGALIDDLWRALPQSRGAPPQAVWFSNFNVMASASEGKGSRQIQVSSALWQRAVHRDVVAVGILAHEMAHLYFRDVRLLRFIQAVNFTTRCIILVTMIAVVVFATTLIAYVSLGQSGANSFLHIITQITVIICFAALLLLLPSISLLMIRRHAAFITALIEIRADASAGLWTTGLSDFARALSNDKQLRAATLADIGHSLVSPGLTHLSNLERVALLNNPARIGTPKLRYFALSLILPFLLPINPLTPLLSGGILDHYLMALVVAAAHVTTVAMVIVAAPALPGALPWGRAVAASAFLCVATMLPRINLYEVGYLLTHLSAGLIEPGGFGTTQLTIPQMLDDIAVTLGGVRDKFANSADGGYILLAIVFGTLALRGLSVIARSMPSQWKWQWVIPGMVAGYVALVVTHDEWRSLSMPPFDIGGALAEWFQHTRWLLLPAPEAVALGALVVQRLVRFFVNAETPEDSARSK